MTASPGVFYEVPPPVLEFGGSCGEPARVDLTGVPDPLRDLAQRVADAEPDSTSCARAAECIAASYGAWKDGAPDGPLEGAPVGWVTVEDDDTGHTGMAWRTPFVTTAADGTPTVICEDCASELDTAPDLAPLAPVRWIDEHQTWKATR